MSKLPLSLGFGKTLETDLVGLGTEMGLGLVGVGVGVHAGVKCQMSKMSNVCFYSGHALSYTS